MNVEAQPSAAPGPGAGPDGAPAAIAVSPILSARYRSRDIERLRATLPNTRIVTLSSEGLPDGPLDDVEVLLRGRITAEAFDRIVAKAPKLRWVHSATAGVERVLTPAARARGLTITNARGVFSQPIAEYVLMMILAISHRLPELLELDAEKTWQPIEGREMCDLTIGVVGLGSIGQLVAERALDFGCRVIATRRRPEGANTPGIGSDWAALPPGLEGRIEVGGPETLPQLLERSDFVVLSLPITPETESMIGPATLALFKRGAWLINISRGRLIDEPALLRALRDGRIGGAVLDTVREEPAPPESPFYTMPNVILTPHTSWSSTRVLDRTIDLFCENLERYQKGEPLLNVVDQSIGY